LTLKRKGERGSIFHFLWYKGVWRDLGYSSSTFSWAWLLRITKCHLSIHYPAGG